LRRSVAAIVMALTGLLTPKRLTGRCLVDGCLGACAGRPGWARIDRQLPIEAGVPISV
jgi:hypothetical protein